MGNIWFGLQDLAFQDHVFREICPGVGLVVSAISEFDEATLLCADATNPFQTMSL